jgi:D-arabinose 5-phosphate isomerase GutQ
MDAAANFDLKALGRRACRDLEAAFGRVDPSQLELLSQELLAAKRIVCYGVGREGLMMEAIAMRLMHQHEVRSFPRTYRPNRSASLLSPMP